MAHHSSTLTQLNTNSSHETMAILSLKMIKCVHVQQAKHGDITLWVAICMKSHCFK